MQSIMTGALLSGITHALMPDRKLFDYADLKKLYEWEAHEKREQYDTFKAWLFKLLSVFMSKKIMPKHQNWFKNISGIKKLLVCILLAGVVFIILLFCKVDPKSRIILGWDAFCLSMIVFSWVLFFSTTQDELHGAVEKQDDGLKVIFIIVLVAVCFSLFGSLLLLTRKGESSFNKMFHTIVSLSPVLLSWLLLHTTFTTRYAHLYHDHNKLNTGSDVGGITFPTKEHPDYIDFAYFSFVIGMTFQVSDVQVNSRVIRRFVLMHSLISFVFNTVIVALTINTIAGLKQ